MANTEKINMQYSTELLNIETNQQFTKDIPLFTHNGTINPMVSQEVNKAIERVLKEKNLIHFPNEIFDRLHSDVKERVAKKLTVSEIRTLSAIVILAQIAKAKGELSPLPKINQVYFEFSLNALYKAMGLMDTKGKKDRETVKNALLTLHRKEFIFCEGKKITFNPLVQLHEVDFKSKSNIKITISKIFCPFEGEQNSQYFDLPVDINHRLRQINKGRPNTAIEFLIKKLYQSKHCSKSSQVSYNRDTLIDIMDLYRYEKQRRNGRINEILNKSFETAWDIGLLDKKVEEATNRLGELKYIFHFKKEN